MRRFILPFAVLVVVLAPVVRKLDNILHVPRGGYATSIERPLSRARAREATERQPATLKPCRVVRGKRLIERDPADETRGCNPNPKGDLK